MSKSKSDAEVVRIFHEQVNMTPDEVEAWLEGPESKKAGTGVGLESGRKIVEILRANPGREEGAYSEEDMEHIRKVVGYNSRHLKQEDHLKDTKTTEELEHTKSTISLRNWGHDPVKVKKQQDGEELGKKQGQDGEGNEADAEGDTDHETEDAKQQDEQDKVDKASAGGQDEDAAEEIGDKRKRSEPQDETDVEEESGQPEKVARRTRSTARAEESGGRAGRITDEEP